MTHRTLTAAFVAGLVAACGGAPAPPPPPEPVATPDTAAPPPAAAPSALRAARVNGATLSYRLVGDSGAPVVFVHGSLGDLNAWDAQVAVFTRNHRVLTYSRRYHPPNPPQDDQEAYSPSLHAEDLAALILALDLAPAHVVGASYGAYTALFLALQHPELVRSVVLAEPPIMPLLTRTEEGDALRRAFYTSALDPARARAARGDSVGAVRAFFDGLSGRRGQFDSLPPARRAAILAHASELRRELLTTREDYLPPVRCRDLGRVHTPVLLLTGESSPRLFHIVTEELARCLMSDTTITIPGAGHAMHDDNPAYYNAVVLRFLATH